MSNARALLLALILYPLSFACAQWHEEVWPASEHDNGMDYRNTETLNVQKLKTVIRYESADTNLLWFSAFRNDSRVTITNAALTSYILTNTVHIDYGLFPFVTNEYSTNAYTTTNVYTESYTTRNTNATPAITNTFTNTLLVLTDILTIYENEAVTMGAEETQLYDCWYAAAERTESPPRLGLFYGVERGFTSRPSPTLQTIKNTLTDLTLGNYKIVFDEGEALDVGAISQTLFEQSFSSVESVFTLFTNGFLGFPTNFLDYTPYIWRRNEPRSASNFTFCATSDVPTSVSVVTNESILEGFSGMEYGLDVFRSFITNLRYKVRSAGNLALISKNEYYNYDQTYKPASWWQDCDPNIPPSGVDFSQGAYNKTTSYETNSGYIYLGVLQDTGDEVSYLYRDYQYVGFSKFTVKVQQGGVWRRTLHSVKYTAVLPTNEWYMPRLACIYVTPYSYSTPSEMDVSVREADGIIDEGSCTNDPSENIYTNIVYKAMPQYRENVPMETNYIVRVNMGQGQEKSIAFIHPTSPVPELSMLTMYEEGFVCTGGGDLICNVSSYYDKNYYTVYYVNIWSDIGFSRPIQIFDYYNGANPFLYQ